MTILCVLARLIGSRRFYDTLVLYCIVRIANSSLEHPMPIVQRLRVCESTRTGYIAEVRGGNDWNVCFVPVINCMIELVE